MPSEIDEVMNLDPLKLTREQREKLIEYNRSYRAKLEGGAKSKKVLEQGERLIIQPILPRPTFKRRV